MIKLIFNKNVCFKHFVHFAANFTKYVRIHQTFENPHMTN